MSTQIQPTIEEEVYLEQPQGFEKRDQIVVRIVCELNKRIHKPKQAAEN